MIKNERFFSLLLREIVFVFFSSLSLSRFSHPFSAAKNRFSFIKKSTENNSSNRDIIFLHLFFNHHHQVFHYCIQHTHTTQYNKNNNKSIHYHGVEEAGANDRALVERRDDDDNEERHLTNFEKSSPVENYRPSVGPGVAKRPGFCGGLSRESAGVVPARERQDTKLGTRSRV